MVKWSNPRKEVAPFPTPRCSSYWKGNVRFALYDGRQLYLLDGDGSDNRYSGNWVQILYEAVSISNSDNMTLTFLSQ